MLCPRIAVLSVFALFIGSASMAHAQQGILQNEAEIDLFALELVAADLQDATRVITIYDPDEDGYIDADEQKRLPWRDKVSDYDLNKDGKLTHLELAVRQAKLRNDVGVTQFDINNATGYLRKHDKNRNKQLDPEEIANGWPSEPEQFDTNSDGIITLDEMTAQFAFNRGLRREMGIEAVDQTGAVQMVRRFDKDGDKRLDAEERADAPLPRPAKDFDEDGDGKVGIMEIATMLARHRNESGLTKADAMKARRLMQQFDINGDNKIVQQEFDSRGFPDGVKEQYKPFDANQDGTITMLEIENHLAAVRKRLGYGPEAFEQAKRLMTRHDSNRSKYIEEFELEEKATPGKLAKSFLKKADLDKDDRISFDELAKQLAKDES